MIRINLIQPPSGASEGKIREAARPGGAPAKLLVISAVVVTAVVGLIYWSWERQIGEMTRRLASEKREAARLAAVQAENQRYQAQLNEIETHIHIIQTLEDNRTGPKALMALLGDTVNRTQGLYLLTVDGKSGRLVIHGESDFINSIADFISALKGTGTISDVELSRVFEDDQSDRVSYKFDLSCLYKPPANAPAPQTAGAAAH